MRRMLSLAASAACLLLPISGAVAATVQLDSTSPSGSDYLFSYGGTLAPTEGVKSGSKLVILDFAGYVAGSVFSPIADVAASAEFTTAGLVLAPGVVDDPTLENLVFTYTGPDFRVDPAGGPYSSFDFSGLTALSTIGTTGLGSFAAISVKNSDAAGSLIYTLGTAAIPSAIPEPGSWALMLAGVAAIGFAARTRRTAFSFS